MLEDLKTFRVARGLTQSEFAKKIGITPEYVSALERGRFPLTDNLKLRIRLVFEGKTAQQTPPQNPKEMKILLNHAQVLQQGIALIVSEISKICEELETYDGGGGKDRKDG